MTSAAPNKAQGLGSSEHVISSSKQLSKPMEIMDKDFASSSVKPFRGLDSNSWWELVKDLWGVSQSPRKMRFIWPHSSLSSLITLKPISTSLKFDIKVQSQKCSIIADEVKNRQRSRENKDLLHVFPRQNGREGSKPPGNPSVSSTS